MTQSPAHDIERRVLVLAPTSKDAAICRTVLAEAGVSISLASSLQELCSGIAEGAAAALITEEALNAHGDECLRETLARQPAWSDLPLLVLMREGIASEMALQVLEALGNVTLLERPVRVLTLVSAVRTALRARSRQYQIRDLLLEAGKTAEKLRDEAKRKDEFLAMLAHELRNPLAPIRNGVAILKLEDGSQVDGHDVLNMMERQIGQMVRLVDDLLDVSRILRGKIVLQREVLELPTIIQQAVETVQPLIEEQRHKLTISFDSGPMLVSGDPVRLAQVFANLLNNAAKYTDPGGHISVHLQLVPNHKLVARVRDNGMGISGEMLGRVFDLFSQAERSLDRSQGGLGLGLTLVRRLIEMHEGSVEVKSDGLGKGSEFVVVLPAIRAKSTAAVRGDNPKNGIAVNHRILVIDDNRDAADSLSRLLRSSGHHVQTSYDGPSALDELARFDPSVVLLDIGLPGMSGYDVARCIRSTRQSLLLVAVTGYGQLEDRRSSLAAGFDHHLVKPVDLGELQRVLSRSKP